MKKTQKKSNNLVHYSSVEETVIRVDSTKKDAYFKKRKKEKLIKRLKAVALVISVSALLISGTFLAKKGIDKFIVLPNEQTKNSLGLSEDESRRLDGMSEEEAWAYLFKKYPELMNIQFPPGIGYEYALQYAENPNMIGYLKIDGTVIDTPVAQADNNKYYLTHDFYGKATSYGAIYASYIDDFDPIDRNTLLYGHNMKDGSRFAKLIQYKSLDFFKSHPVIEFNTLYEKHKWKVYAVFITNGDTEGDNGYFFDFTFDNCSDKCFAEYVEELDKRKLYDTGVDLLPADKLLTLCTCSFDYKDARLVVVARMVRNGESEETDVNLASYKSTPVKYPSSFYSSQSKNPYKNDKKWYLY